MQARNLPGHRMKAADIPPEGWHFPVTTLSQVIAIEKTVRSQAYADLTAAHHGLQKPVMLTGISRTYQPRDEEGEQLPAESTRVQVVVEDVLKATAAALTRLFDVTVTKDKANMTAVADVVIDGVVILPAVPVSYLLFLEKQLTDLHTFVAKLPVLDSAESWRYDDAVGYSVTEPAHTTRTKKIPRNHVKAEATEHHPAQVDVYYEDVVVGTWRTVKSSGALRADRARELRERVETLQRAVKFAREQANGLVIQDEKVGEKVFSYLFAR